MWLATAFLIWLVPLLVLCDPPQLIPSYLVIDNPAKGDKWLNGQTNYATWTTGLLQNISVFDVELTRLSTDGVIFVARNVPIGQPPLPIYLQDIAPGDDYFMVFINSTHGRMYSLSGQFSILHASSSNPLANSPDKVALETVTVTGSANSTAFVPTFDFQSDAVKIILVSISVVVVTGVAAIAGTLL